MIDTLPPSSFVAFTARRLAHARVAWCPPGASRERLLDDFAFSMVQGEGRDEGRDEGQREASELHLAETREFLAERYGGAGLVNNGGGVRCGLYGGLQVKGIGRNPLGGKVANFWYSHGGASLEEALREAAWGEVCDAVLPHGGVRVRGVIATGATVSFDAGGFERRVPGALIVRDAALRPGHFMRAVHFQPNDEVASRQVGDTARTRSAIAGLQRGLAAALGLPAQASTRIDDINQGLMEVARRFAAQLAATRAKKIVHGALTCSNICIDGRLLDYGTITTVSDFGRVIVARGFPDMLSDHTCFIPTLRNLVFYCHKYLDGATARGLLQPELLVQHYLQAFNARAMLEFAKLSGVTEARLQALPGDLVPALFASIDEIVACGTGQPFKLRDMPARMGRLHLGSVLKAAALNGSIGLDRRLEPLLPDAAMRERFVRAWTAVREAADAAAPLAAGFVAFNACRLNSTVPALYRAGLMLSIDALIEAGDVEREAGRFVAGLRDQAANLLADPRDGCIVLRPSKGGGALTVDEGRGACRDGVSLPMSELIASLDGLSLSADEESQLVRA